MPDPSERRVLGRAPVPGEHEERYGPHPDQVADRWTGGGPPVVLVHGGFWRQRYDRAHLSPLAADLASRGREVVLAEYRRGPGSHRRAVADVCAVLARHPGAVLVGHSAGGQLALCAARALTGSAAGHGGAPVAVVVLAPVADLAMARRLALGGGAVAAYLGPDPDGTAEAAADPARDPATAVPTVLLHGTADPDVPAAVGLSYARAARAAGQRTLTVRLLRGAGHYDAVDPGTGLLAAALREAAGPTGDRPADG